MRTKRKLTLAQLRTFTCVVCRWVFEARRHTARYCSPRCRMRKLRSTPSDLWRQPE